VNIVTGLGLIKSMKPQEIIKLISIHLGDSFSQKYWISSETI